MTHAPPLSAKAVAIAPAHTGVRWHKAQLLPEAMRSAAPKAEIRRLLAASSFADRAAATALEATL